MALPSKHTEAKSKQAKPMYPDLANVSKEVNDIHNSSGQSHDSSFRPDDSFSDLSDDSSSTEPIPPSELKGLHDDNKLPPTPTGRRPLHLADGSPTSPENTEGVVRRAKSSRTTNSNLNVSHDTRYTSAESKHRLAGFSPDTSSHLPSSEEQLKETFTESKSQATGFTENVRGYLFILIVFFGVFLVIALAYYAHRGHFWRYSDVSFFGKPRFDEFQQTVNEMKKNHPENDKAWKRLLASSQDQFIEPPDKPSVAVLVYRPGAQPTARCLAVKFAEQLSAVFAPGSSPYIVPEHLIASSKLSLDVSLRNAFDQEVKVAIFPRLDKFDSDSLLLMHDFCDDQHAPYKNVSLIFETLVPETVAESKVEQYVTSLWEKLVGPDEAGALISRVWRNVALVGNSNRGSLSALGCQ